jgi:hypothetical protein
VGLSFGKFDGGCECGLDLRAQMGREARVGSRRRQIVRAAKLFVGVHDVTSS